MNPNNDDNVDVNANCYYDDTNNIMSFYLLWEQVQVRILDDDHSDVTDKNVTYNNSFDPFVPSDPFEYNTSIDKNDVPTDICELDTTCDCLNIW